MTYDLSRGDDVMRINNGRRVKGAHVHVQNKHSTHVHIRTCLTISADIIVVT